MTDDGTETGTPDESRTEDTMTDTGDETDDGTEHRAADDGNENQAVDDRTGRNGGRDLRRTLDLALLAGLSLLALIATLQLYFNVSSAINQWITHEYRSLFQAAFNLTVLLLVGAGMVWQVRRMRE